MRRVLPILVTVAAALALAGTGTAATPRLAGTDGPSFTITLKSGTKVVKTLKAGSYTLVVADKSSTHSFHLFGPGVNKTTAVGFIGTKTWTVKLKPGTYTYQCDVHAASGMKGTFKVTA